MKLNGCKFIIFIVFLCCFIFPTYFFTINFGIDLTEYFFLIISLIVYIATLVSERKITKLEFFSVIYILFLCYVRKSITPLYLLELLVAYKFSMCLVGKKNEVENINLVISILFVFIYSILYFGFNGRYIYTGLKEINQCSYAILMLFLLIRKKNKTLGNFFLLLGNLTFSRNYLLGVTIFFLVEHIRNSHFFDCIYKYINFKNLLIGSITLILLLSFSFDIAYKNNHLSQYQNGWKRYLTIYDYSNYFRFTVNSKLLEIYIKNPKLMLIGLDDEEFYSLSQKISIKKGTPYRQIKPHNYFFSYLRIYGIFSIIIFIILAKIMKEITSKTNISILIVIFVYASILGIGFANYWLFLSIITMLIYKDERKSIKNE